MNNWEKEFDKRFLKKIPYEDWAEIGSLKTKISYAEKWSGRNSPSVKYIKSFLRSAIKNAIKEAVEAKENELLEDWINHACYHSSVHIDNTPEELDDTPEEQMICFLKWRKAGKPVIKWIKPKK